MSDTFDRDAARDALDRFQESGATWDVVLNALEACVRPAIDRDALDALLAREFRGHSADQIEATTDRVLALLRPVDGVVLTREEAAYARRWLPTNNSQRARDLAARLEAAS